MPPPRDPPAELGTVVVHDAAAVEAGYDSADSAASASAQADVSELFRMRVKSTKSGNAFVDVKPDEPFALDAAGFVGQGMLVTRPTSKPDRAWGQTHVSFFTKRGSIDPADYPGGKVKLKRRWFQFQVCSPLLPPRPAEKAARRSPPDPQMQGRFLDDPGERTVMFGAEIAKPPVLSWMARRLAGLVTAFTKAINKYVTPTTTLLTHEHTLAPQRYVHVSLGDSKSGEITHMTTPVFTFQNLVETPAGEAVSVLCGATALSYAPLTRCRPTQPPPIDRPLPDGLGASTTVNPKMVIDTSTTYSFSYHMMYIDWRRYVLKNVGLGGETDLRTWFPDVPVRFVLYSVPKPTKKSGGRHDPAAVEYLVEIEVEYLGPPLAERKAAKKARAARRKAKK